MDNIPYSSGDAYTSIDTGQPAGRTKNCPLKNLFLPVGKKFKYVFDFEDDWVFQCRVLKIINEQTEKPVILRKKGEIPEQYPYFPDDFESAETATVILDQEEDGAIVCVDLPEIYSKTKLKKAYRARGLPEPKVDLLHSCFDAAANFYGIIPLQTLFALYNAQNAPLPRDRFAAFAEAARHEQHNYRIIGTDDFLRVKCGAAPEAAECFLLCICAVMTTGLASPNTIVTALRSKGLQISSGAAQVHAEQLLSDIYLHMPVYLYRGHPPLEAETLLESES